MRLNCFFVNFLIIFFKKEQTTNILEINENEENKHQLAILSKEHLKLQHTYNLLQQQMVESMDPERVELVKIIT